MKAALSVRTKPADETASARSDEGGFLMVALLVGMAVTAVWMSAMLPTWRQQAQRQREDDLIFRGEQYARAIALFADKNNGALPTSIDDLVQQRYLRKKWKDPITGKDFMVLGSGSVVSPISGGRGGTPGGGTPSPQQTSGLAAGGIRGVYSESTDTSIRIYNNAQQYNQWLFDYQTALLRRGQVQAGQPRGGGAADGRGGARGGANVGGGPRRGGDAARGRGGAGGPARGGATGGGAGSGRGAGS
jgi:type II secretory pathway pseudopilin PulG